MNPIRKSPHALLLFPLLFVTSCSLLGLSDKDSKDTPKEVPDVTLNTADLPSDQALREAEELFEQGLYTAAKKSFERLIASYPNGPYREVAEVKSAECLFLSGDYEDAGNQFEQFTKEHPYSKLKPYAFAQAARGFQLANTGAGRDPAPLEKSILLYSELIDNFPDSPYTPPAKKFRRDAERQLAEHENMIVQFYEKTGELRAAKARQKEFETKWAYLGLTAGDPIEEPVTPGTPEIYVASAFNLSGPKLLSAKVQSLTPFSTLDSPSILLASRLPAETEPDVVGKSPDSPGILRAQLMRKPETKLNTVLETQYIHRLECRLGDFRALFLHLGRDFSQKESSDLLSQYAFVPENEAGHSLKIPGLNAAKPRTLSCGALGRLTIQEDGELHLSGSGPIRVFALFQPARLAIFPD